MAEILNFFIDALQDQFMHPARFIREINKRSNLQVILKEPIQTADAIEIIHWNRWENRNLNNKYSLIMRAGQQVYCNYIPEIEHITAVTETENWRGDIQDIFCLGASKSDLRLFKTLDDFAIEINSNLIAELSEENLKKNLLWENGRILDYAFFHCHGWDNNRIHLCNSGGSHHFSAARYIASQLNKKIPINGRLTTFRLNSESIFSLLSQYNLFAVDSSDFCFIINECENFGAPVGFYPAPPPFTGKTIIFLPRTNKRSIRIAKLFKRFQLFDFGQLLLESLRNQEERGYTSFLY